MKARGVEQSWTFEQIRLAKNANIHIEMITLKKNQASKIKQNNALEI